MERRVAGNFVFNPPYLAFIPGMEEVVANGFAQLETMPEWYQYSLGLSLLPHLAFVVLLSSLERSNGSRAKGTFTAKKRLRVRDVTRRTSTNGINRRRTMADVTFERISKWKLLPRFMMLVMTLMSWRCAEWFMNLDAPTAAQSAFVSVVMGAMTGAFGIWMGGENREANK